jgi:hypothetical protein
MLMSIDVVGKMGDEVFALDSSYREPVVNPQFNSATRGEGQ